VLIKFRKKNATSEVLASNTAGHSADELEMAENE